MRTEQIIYLREIHATSSLHLASNNLHISVQALSVSMLNLEKELGIKLINRSRNGSFLTKEGVKLLEAGDLFLESIKRIKNENIEKYSHLHNSTIKLSITNGLMETYFPNLATQFFNDFPSSNLKFNTRTYNSLISQISAKNDFGLMAMQTLVLNDDILINIPEELAYTTLFKGKFFCMVHSKSPFFNYKTISLKTMLKRPTLVYSPSLDVLSSLINKVDTPNIINVEEFAVFQNMIRNGIGSTFIAVTDNCPYQYDSPFKIIPFKEKINFYVIITYHKNNSLSPTAKEFIDYTQNFFKENPHTTFIKY